MDISKSRMAGKMPLDPYFYTHCRLIVFAFSDNFSAENSKFSEVSRNQRNQLLDCLDIGARMYILGKVRGKYDK